MDSPIETNNQTILQEVDWLPAAVHLHKGCDRGQETVARAHNLGRPPRRLVFCTSMAHTTPCPRAALRLSLMAGSSAAWRRWPVTMSWVRSPWPSSSATSAWMPYAWRPGSAPAGDRPAL